MYVICTYDVDKKRCAKIMKILRKYLFHVQRSVFEGTLTPKKYEVLQQELQPIVQQGDSVMFFISYNEKQIYKKGIGEIKDKLNLIFDM